MSNSTFWVKDTCQVKFNTRVKVGCEENQKILNKNVIWKVFRCQGPPHHCVPSAWTIMYIT